jgi:hypothetical protein
VFCATLRDLQHRRTYIYRIRDVREEISSTTSSSSDSFLPYFCHLASVSTSDPSVTSVQWRYRPGAALGVSLFLFLNIIYRRKGGLYAQFHTKAPPLRPEMQ